jgi:hypothetical protein
MRSPRSLRRQQTVDRTGIRTRPGRILASGPVVTGPSHSAASAKFSGLHLYLLQPPHTPSTSCLQQQPKMTRTHYTLHSSKTPAPFVKAKPASALTLFCSQFPCILPIQIQTCPLRTVGLSLLTKPVFREQPPKERHPPLVLSASCAGGLNFPPYHIFLV